MKLTPSSLSAWIDTPLQAIKEINASKKEITSIEDLSACAALRKLNLSNNSLASQDSIANLKLTPQLTWLNLSFNQLKVLHGIKHLRALKVLNMSHNEIAKVGSDVSSLEQLNALILNHNKLETLEYIDDLVNLNTIVVSHNALNTLPPLPRLTGLTKLSAAHNQLELIPDLSPNVALKEVRLNDNKIKTIPDTFRQCGAIETLDFGNNLLSDWSDVAALGSLVTLHNLNLKGNPVTQKEDYIEKILELVPSLRILDGTRFDPKFLERKEKQKANLKLVEKKQRLKREKAEKQERENDGEETQARKPRHKKLLQEVAGEKTKKESTTDKKQKSKALKIAEGKAKRVSKRALAEATTTETEKKKKKQVKSDEKTVSKQKQLKTKPADVVATKKRKTADLPAAESDKKPKRSVTDTSEDNSEVPARKSAKGKNSKATAAEKTTKTKKDGDEFFASEALPATLENTTRADSSADNMIEVVSDTSQKASQKDRRKNVPVAASKEANSGVVSVVDKTKKMHKKARKGVVDVVAALEESNAAEESHGTGLDVGGWD